MNIRKSRKGMTLIELIISLALLGIIIVPISGYALSSMKNSLESEKNQKASFIGQRFLEEINAYDEIILNKNVEGKRYFKLLDGEELVEKSISKITESSSESEILDEENTKETLSNDFYGQVKKDKFEIEMELKEDKYFEYNSVNNLESIRNEAFTLTLSENIGIGNVELKEDSTQTKDFKNDLVVILEDNLTIKVNDSITNDSLINYTKTSNDKNVLVIFIEKGFSLNKNIEIKNKTDKTFTIYVVKHNESTGKVNIFCSEGSIFINDEIDLLEKNIDGKRFDYSIKVKSKDEVIFEGSSSRNLIIR